MRTSATILIALATILFAPSLAKACLCYNPTTQSEFFRNAGAVFSGKVAEVKEVKDKDGNFIGHRVKVLVEKSWKFVQEREVTFFNSGLCGYGVQVGERYLFYSLVNTENVLKVEGVCSINSTILSYSPKNLEDLEWREEVELPKEKKSPKRNAWLFP